jgi:hypothetical protein
MEYSKLLLATENGELALYDPNKNEHKLVFKNGTQFGNMGLHVDENFIYVSSNAQVYKLKRDDFSKVTQTKSYGDVGMHQLNMYDGKVYVTVTKMNEIWVYDENLNRLETHVIKPPNGGKPKYKKNYNHINNIILKDDKFYINLNWYTTTQYSSSGVLITDKEFNEIERFEMGWESHDFQFMGDDMVTICASSGVYKKINHPHRGGIMIDNELVFEHEPNEAFCKGLTWDDKYFYLCGGQMLQRGDRKFGGSVIYIVNKDDYSLSKKIMNTNIKNIKGVLTYE